MLRRRLLGCLLVVLMCLGHGRGLAAGLVPPPPGMEIEPQLLQALAQTPRAGYLIYFDARPDLSPAYAMDWEARGRFVMEALQATAEASQAPVRAYLEAQGARFTAFWIDNVIVVESPGAASLQRLAGFPQISRVRARRIPILYEPEIPPRAAEMLPMAIESSLAHIGADAAWALGYTGQGFVIANIDTGVRYTHNALRSRYRGTLGASFNHNYNWWDPYGTYPNAPFDDHNHGTHTMGTMVGDDGGANRIGIAPGARWIACRGFSGGGATDAALLECAQWVAAPWDLAGSNPSSDLRPHVVNNSWGDCARTYDPWYQGVVDTWHAMGIYPIFANGNTGSCGYSAPPECNTVGNPARYGNVSGIGSTGTTNGAYANHSNRGPTDAPDTVNPGGYPTLKPQVVAPGVNIRSSLRTNDSSYGLMTGTSMSAPHVAGLVALIWQAAPCLTGNYAATEALIQRSATPVTANLPVPGCAGEGPGNLPNQSTGWGEINALAAVEAAALLCDGETTLSGVVRDARTGWPLYAGIRVGHEQAPGAWSDPVTGIYSITLPSAPVTLTVTAWVEGYLPRDVALPVRVEDTVLDIELDPDLAACLAPGYVLSSTPVFAESFDTQPPALPSGWAQASVAGAGGAWATRTATAHPHGFAPHSGTGLVYFNASSVDPGTASRLYRTVDLDLSTGTGARLALWLYEDDEYDDANDRVQVQVSTTGGTTWMEAGAPLSRYNPVEMWRRHEVNLSAVAGPGMTGVRIGFLGTGEMGNDLHLDDVTVSTTQCVPASGGLVVGHVRDANTLAPLTGATVENSQGYTTLTGTTLDPAVEDGFYTLFVPASATTAALTATLTAYGPATAMVAVQAGETVARDLHLPAGLPTVTPTGLHAVTPVGSSTSLPLLLGNVGSAAFDYRLVIRDRGSLPPGVFTDRVLTDRVLTSRVLTARVCTSGPDTFGYTTMDSNAPNGPPYRWVDITETGTPIVGLADDNFAGPLLLGFPFDFYGTVQDRFYAGSNGILTFGSGSGSLSNQCPLPNVTTPNALIALLWDDLDFTRGGLATTQTFATCPYGEQQACTVVTYANATHFGSAAGSAGTWQALLFENGSIGIQIQSAGTETGAASTTGIEAPGGLDGLSYGCNTPGSLQEALAICFAYPHEPSNCLSAGTVWLTTGPVTGTLTAGAQQSIGVTFDSSGLQPGDYFAGIEVVTDSPYDTLTVPVTLTVQPQTGWAHVRGSVTGLGLCDAAPHPLVDAAVTLESSQGVSWTVATTAEGSYGFWLEPEHSPLTVTFAAADHLGVQVTGVSLTSGVTTTLDAALRHAAPCITVEPEAIEVTLARQGAVTLPLTIANTGAAGFAYTVSETAGGVTSGPGLTDVVPWLTARPSSGVLDPDSTQVIEVALDARLAGSPGSYTATLLLTGDGAPTTSLPVTLTVTSGTKCYLPVVVRR